MNARIAAPTFAMVCAVSVSALGQAEQPDKNINNYLVDITGGVVSAGGIVGFDSPITPIETSKDFVVAIQPLTSDHRKSSFGLAITPAKTTLFPMAGNTYASSPYMRLLGNLTLSYAQNKAEAAGQEFKRWAYSIDTVHYFKLADDPVYAGSLAFKACADKTGPETEARLAELFKQFVDGKITQAQLDAERQKLLAARAPGTNACIQEALSRLPWNSGRMSVSHGDGRVSPVGGGGPSYSLGQHFNLNAQYPVHTTGLVQVSLRHARDALTIGTLGAAEPEFKGSRLAALRYTYGGQVDTGLRVMAEVSNSKSSSAGAFRDAFMYAVGVDKKLAGGTWLEFRLGRSRVNLNGDEQTTGLLNLNVAPTLFMLKR
jgi:hypothetical protein